MFLYEGQHTHPKNTTCTRQVPNADAGGKYSQELSQSQNLGITPACRNERTVRRREALFRKRCRHNRSSTNATPLIKPLLALLLLLPLLLPLLPLLLPLDHYNYYTYYYTVCLPYSLALRYQNISKRDYGERSSHDCRPLNDGGHTFCGEVIT